MTREIDRMMNNISLSTLDDEDYEIPVFEKRTKVIREDLKSPKTKTVEKHSFKRFLADQINGN